MYNVFADFHHAGLLQSLILLFEKRLGGNLYRPIGMEWADNGYWKVFDHPATRLQYLTYDQGYRPQDGTKPLNIIEDVQSDVYYCHDIDSDKYNKAISLQKFLTMPIDIVIASIPQHIYPFQKLCELHPNHPKLIYQIGNAWDVHTTDKVQNVMASAYVLVPEGTHSIIYHQEFDMRVFEPKLPVHNKNITSLVNCFDVSDMFKDDWHTFTEVEKNMPLWSFKALGGQCRDGAAHGNKEVAEAIRTSRFIWHTKVGGDGYGHILHNAAAVGRPMIVRKSQYNGKMGGDLMIDGRTVIDIDGLSTSQIIAKIDHYNQPEIYDQMCVNMRERFEQTVNFEHEAEAIKEFLRMLI